MKADRMTCIIVDVFDGGDGSRASQSAPSGRASRGECSLYGSGKRNGRARNLTSCETKLTLGASMNVMNWRIFFRELTAIVAAAVVCAVVANTLAARERRLALVGTYPAALTVPAHVSLPTHVVAPQPQAATSSAAPVEPAMMAPAVSTQPATASTVKMRPPGSGVKPLQAPAVPAQTGQAPETDILARFPPHEKVAYVEIGGDDVAALHRAGALFLDARRTSVYEQGHIPGASTFSVWEADIDDKVKQLLDEGRDQKQPIVVYCSGGDCEDSHMLAQKLWGIFFNNVLVYKDGFPDWQKRGYEIRMGSSR
jgi:rhodanese-related sulfurtransferase